MTIDAHAFFKGTPTSTPKTAWAHVDEQGRLVLPPAAAAQLGLAPGAQVRLEQMRNGLRLHRPVTHLAKLYVEPTNACNLECATCFRHGWDEPIGRMSEASFDAILDRPGRAGRAAHGLLRRDRGAAVASADDRLGCQGARAGRTHRADHQRDAAQRAAGARPDRRRVGSAVGVHRRRDARRAMPMCGWAPSWRTSSPTWRVSARCARAAITPGPSSGSRSWR